MKTSNPILVVTLSLIALLLCSGTVFAAAPGANKLILPTPTRTVSVPMILGDYTNRGMRTKTGNTDIPNLIVTLKKAGVRDFMHLVWTDKMYPNAWNEFKQMASEFQKANINLWLYLTPPTEGVPEPFGDNYVQWALECAKLAKKYPVVKGIVIDDFDQNISKFTPEYCKQMMENARTVAPDLALLVVHYYRFKSAINQHVKAGVIDGVVFPYFSKPLNHRNTTQLAEQIMEIRSDLDKSQKAGGINKHLPLIVMIYATKLSNAPDSPTPEYVKECLEIVKTATKQGLADGAIIYQLPKNQQDFLNSVSTIYHSW